jgi:hypothetical protein
MVMPMAFVASKASMEFIESRLSISNPVNPIFGQSQKILSEFGMICDGHRRGGVLRVLREGATR